MTDWEKIYQEIEKADSIMLTTHENPDGDGIGSIVALYDHLTAKGKVCRILLTSKLPEEYHFLDPDNNLELLKEESISHMETSIERMNKELPPLKEFILPGGDEFSARLHIARSVCRRVERSIVKLLEEEDGRIIWIKYLNRLSDYFFVLARYHTIKNNINEDQWSKL